MSIRSEFEYQPDLAEFVRERLKTKKYHEIRAEMEAAFPGRKLPSRSSIGKFAIGERGLLVRRWWKDHPTVLSGASSTKAPEPMLPFVVEADPDLALMVRSLAGRVSLETMLVVCRTSFPRIALTRTEMAQAVAAEIARRRPSARAVHRRRLDKAAAQPQLGE